MPHSIKADAIMGGRGGRRRRRRRRREAVTPTGPCIGLFSTMVILISGKKKSERRERTQVNASIYRGLSFAPPFSLPLSGYAVRLSIQKNVYV